MTSAKTGYWVVLPTYNESENIAPLLDRLLGLDVGLNILIVDDNSPDGTGDIVAAISARNDRVHLMSRTGKRGLGAAYLAGFEYALNAGAEVLISMDGDFSHQPEAIPGLIVGLGRAGCVVGSRYVAGGSIENWPARRKVLSAAANRFVRLLFRIPIADCTSGFRVYRRSVIEDVVRVSPRSQGYSFLVEMLWIAAIGPLPIIESPICFVERQQGTSKMALREVIGGIRSLLSLRSKTLFTSELETAPQHMGVEASDPLIHVK